MEGVLNREQERGAMPPHMYCLGKVPPTPSGILILHQQHLHSNTNSVFSNHQVSGIKSTPPQPSPMAGCS